MAVKIVRKHRLWETFLVQHMNFAWDEVHEVAEQLEHIHSDKLLSELDNLLGYPKFDPHGDPIPDANGKLPTIRAKALAEIEPGKKVKVVNVLDNSSTFLKYLDKHGIGLHASVTIKEVEEFDQSILVELKNRKEIFLSHEAAQKIYVE
jgi:DtxR family Mn-dependent transcriptional regulator